MIKKDFSTPDMVKTILEILDEKDKSVFSDKPMVSSDILIIEDNPGMRNVLTTFLRQRGFNVKEAVNGEEALLSMQVKKPKLVILDERMPGMDGLMVLQKIKELDSSIKVIMLTAVDDEDVVKEAGRLGASDYITKPCNLSRLEASILSLLVSEKTPKAK